MAGAHTFSFGKAERLKSKKAIDELFDHGQSFHVPGIKVLWMHDATATCTKAGVAVSSRHFKKATDRNRVKRLLREAYRLQKNQLAAGACLILFFIFTGKELPGYEQVYKSIGLALKRLSKLSNENAEANS